MDMDKLKDLSKAFNEAIAEDERSQEEFWAELTPDQQLDAFCCVVRRIFKGDVIDQGSYRYVLYDVCGFGPEAYVPAQCAGYLDIHNLIFDGLEFRKATGEERIAAEAASLEEFINEKQEKS